MTSTTTITDRQAQVLATFMTGREADGSGRLIMGRTANFTQAEAKALVKKGLVDATFTTGQFGIKTWTITAEGAEVFSTIRILKGRTFTV